MSREAYSAERIMDFFWEYRDNGQLDESINTFRGLGYSEEIVDHVLSPDAYYFPNNRHGELTKPNSVSEERLPVVALKPGEAPIYNDAFLHSLQKTALTFIDFEKQDIEDIEQHLKQVSDTISSANNGVGCASTHTRLVVIKKAAPKVVQSAPALVFNVDHDGTSLEGFTDGVVHELVHVTQTLDNPLRLMGDKKASLQRELEAYAVQAQLVSNYVVPYTLGTAMAGEVNNFRRKYLGADDFTPTDDFVRMASQDDVISKVVRSLG